MEEESLIRNLLESHDYNPTRKSKISFFVNPDILNTDENEFIRHIFFNNFL